MATIAVDLYALWQRDRFVTSLSNPAAPSLPAIVAGDTWNISLYFVDDTSPMQIHRFASSDVSARIRAQGNNHGYADQAASSEIAPATSVAITEVQLGEVGGTHNPEIQRIHFASIPVGGWYTITFPGPAHTEAGDATIAPKGTTGPIAYNATLADIRAAIVALPFRNGRPEQGDQGSSWGAYITLAGTPDNFTINYADGSPAHGPVPLCSVYSAPLQYMFGWSIVLPFTASDFNDYLLSANGPSFFEVMLDGGQAAFVQLTGDPGGGNAPAFTNGPPPNSGSIGLSYSFQYSASGFPAPTFSLTSGALPTGLTLTAAGFLSGTPTATATFTGIVTATNSVGSVDQIFSITIGAGSGGPGPGGVGRLPSYRDDANKFHVLDSSDGPYSEDRDDEWPGLVIWHVPYAIDFDDYAPTVPGVGTYVSPFGYFWKDTPVKFIGDGIVEFERLFHNIPGDADRPVSVTKNYQSAQYTFQGGVTIDLAIISFSRDITANCRYHFALGNPGGLPVIPFIQIIPFLRGQLLTDLGTGFPTGTLAGHAGAYTNNFGVSALPGSSVEHVLGLLYCRKILTG